MFLTRSLPEAVRSLYRRLFRGRDTAPSDAHLASAIHKQFLHGGREIETSIEDPAVAQALLDRVIAQWRALGDREPFWSNDTRDQFKRDRLTEQGIRSFYEEGAWAARAIEAFESRSGVAVGRGVCVELGCGVGKHTHVLARRFTKVIAVDVSVECLGICSERMKTFGIENVETLLLSSLEDLRRCDPADFFFSLSALQHNPPPVQKIILSHALAGLRLGGCCLFQTPDFIDGYSFSNDSFAREPNAMFDLHCLPKTDVLALLERQRMQLLDFAPDLTIGAFGSYTYFAWKPN